MFNFTSFLITDHGTQPFWIVEIIMELLSNCSERLPVFPTFTIFNLIGFLILLFLTAKLVINYNKASKPTTMAHKRRKLGSSNNCIFTHKQDIQQFKNLFHTIQNSESPLLNQLKIPTAIYKEIAEYSCGVIRECDNEDCENQDKQIILLLSEIANPTLYKNDDVVFDINTTGFFAEDDEKPLIYCQQCKEEGDNCERCGSFSFYEANCYRCSRLVCEFCSAPCEHRRCKIKYCIGGDVTSFTSGCGERFLDEMKCVKCDEEYTLCHEHGRFEVEFSNDEKFKCYECGNLEKMKKNEEKRKKKKEEKEKEKQVDLSKIINACKECKKENDDGRDCDNCGVFVCEHHMEKYKHFCAGTCEKFYCKTCVRKHGKLTDCPRELCDYMVCDKCMYKCENCWTMLMMKGVDDDEIEEALRNGDYSDLE